MVMHNRRKGDKKGIWTAVPYDLSGHKKGGPWVTVENQDGTCLGFRFFSERQGKFIAYLETHYPDAWVTHEYARIYMYRMQKENT